MEMRPETTNHASSGASKAHGVTFWVHLDFETMNRQRTTALRWDIGGHLRNELVVASGRTHKLINGDESILAPQPQEIRGMTNSGQKRQ